MQDNRRRVMSGYLAVLAGSVTGLLMVQYPERLRVPASVGYCASAAFLLAGLALLAQAYSRHRVHAWLVAFCVAAMLVPCAWIAFGPGQRHCAASLPLLNAFGSEWLCRGVFGFGAVVVAGLLAWVVARILAKQTAD